MAKGFLSLEDSLHHFYSDFPNDLTLKNLIQHTSGFIKDIEHKQSALFTSYSNVEQIIPRQYQRRKHQFRYTNYNYAVLGALLEKTHKKKLNEIFQEYFNENVDSINVNLIDDEHIDQLRVKNYLRRGRKLYFHPASEFPLWTPAANALGSSKDVLKFLRYHMNQVFIETIIQDPVLVKKRKSRNGKLYEEYYGLGYRIMIVDKKLQYIFHNGFLYGALATMLYMPEHDIGFVALSNTSTFPKQYFSFGSRILNIVNQSLKLDEFEDEDENDNEEVNTQPGGEH